MKLLYTILCELAIIASCSSYYVPICKWSDAKTNKANVFHVNGVEVVVMKPSYSQVVAFKDHCPHRGASFQGAMVANNTVTCKYHAFEYNLDDGLLQYGVGTTAKCSQLTNIPVVRRQNLIWGCIDSDLDSTPPPLQHHDVSSSYRRIYGSTKIKCNVNTLVENVLDSRYELFCLSLRSMQSDVSMSIVL